MKALRHSVASRTISAVALPMTEVAYLMGHASPAVTLKVYADWVEAIMD